MSSHRTYAFPKRKLREGSPAEPNDTEINSFVNGAVKFKHLS